MNDGGLAISEFLSDYGSDDKIDDKFEVSSPSKNPPVNPLAETDVSQALDYVDDANDDPQQAPLIVDEATETSVSVPPSDSQQVHSDLPPQSTVVRAQVRRLATYIPDSKEPSRRMDRTLSEVRALNEADLSHA